MREYRQPCGKYQVLYDTKNNSNAPGVLLLTMILASAELLLMARRGQQRPLLDVGDDVADLWIADGEAQELIGPRDRL